MLAYAHPSISAKVQMLGCRLHLPMPVRHDRHDRRCSPYNVVASSNRAANTPPHSTNTSQQPILPLFDTNSTTSYHNSQLLPDSNLYTHPTQLPIYNPGKALLHWLVTIVPHAASLHQLASRFCNYLECLIPTPSGIRAVPAADSQFMISLQHGNFAPVAHECPPQPCQVDEQHGPLPSFLEGTYVRNGPNQQFASNARNIALATHPFDGDGMLHAVTFRPGAPPTYCCRYVHTSRFLQEEAAQQTLFTKTFSCLTATASFVATAHMSLAALRHVLGLVDLSQGMGLANTALVFHHGKLLALAEDDLPYALDIQDDGDLVNRGRYSFKGNFKPRTMTSHPKVDAQSGEMVYLSYNAFFRPYLTFFFLQRDGTIFKQAPVYLKEPCMIHDFALTPNYIIFPETQLVFHPADMLQGKAPIKFEPRKMQRFGVLRRNAKDVGHVQWFEAPRCDCFHIVNAWEENVEIPNNGSIEEIVLMVPNLSSPNALMSGNFDEVKSEVVEVRLNMKFGQTIQRPLLWDNNNDINLEMGTMNEHFRGVKNEFAYLGMMGRSPQSFRGIVKLDFQSRKIVAHRHFDENYFASEPMFVPKASFQEYRESKKAREDEGCLLCFLHHDNPDHATNDNEKTLCELLVLDTQSPTLEVMASIKIPRRVPYGFHGLFVPHSIHSTY